MHKLHRTVEGADRRQSNGTLAGAVPPPPPALGSAALKALLRSL